MVFLKWATRALIKAQLLLQGSYIQTIGTLRFEEAAQRKRRIKSEFVFFQSSLRIFSSYFDVDEPLWR